METSGVVVRWTDMELWIIKILFWGIPILVHIEDAVPVSGQL